ncbi:MAG: hypothetical protein II951_06750 [Bacteroidales bacterium]|nr:hypothetical protein [Bacteroidales bacterium]
MEAERIETKEEETIETMVIEYDRERAKWRTVLWILWMVGLVVFVAFNGIMVLVPIMVMVFVLILGCLIERTRKDRRVVIDKNGIATTTWKMGWNSVKRCYIVYYKIINPILVVETMRGAKKEYGISGLKFEWYEVAQQVDRAAGRKVFDRQEVYRWTQFS